MIKRINKKRFDFYKCTEATWLDDTLSILWVIDKETRIPYYISQNKVLTSSIHNAEYIKSNFIKTSCNKIGYKIFANFDNNNNIIVLK